MAIKKLSNEEIEVTETLTRVNKIKKIDIEENILALETQLVKEKALLNEFT